MIKRVLTCVCLGIIVISCAGLTLAQDEAVEEKIVYQFKDASELTEFEQMFFTKQAITTRIAVLQSYLAMETANLNALDTQITERFNLNLDPQKAYQLLRDEMLIQEISPMEQPQQ